ncbi:hypothetical protein Tco_0003450 [Tanacetum coccineum]
MELKLFLISRYLVLTTAMADVFMQEYSSKCLVYTVTTGCDLPLHLYLFALSNPCRLHPIPTITEDHASALNDGTFPDISRRSPADAYHNFKMMIFIKNISQFRNKQEQETRGKRLFQEKKVGYQIKETLTVSRRVKGKNVEESRISPIPSPTRSPRNLSTLVSSDTEKLQELTVTSFLIPSSVHLNRKSQISSTDSNCTLTMAIPSYVDACCTQLILLQQQDIAKTGALKMKFENRRQTIVWENRKGNSIVSLFSSMNIPKITPLVQSCQRDPEAPALSLINQDLLFLKKGNSGHEKIILSLHKFPAIIFNDDDIEERTSR